MEEFLNILVEYIAIWAPSLVAILGVVGTVLTACKKTKEAFDELKKDKILKDVNTKLNDVIKENEEVVRCNKLLLDEITRIKNFADKKKED